MFYHSSYSTLGSNEIDVQLARDGVIAESTLDILLLEPEGSDTVYYYSFGDLEASFKADNNC